MALAVGLQGGAVRVGEGFDSVSDSPDHRPDDPFVKLAELAERHGPPLKEHGVAVQGRWAGHVNLAADVPAASKAMFGVLRFTSLRAG